MSADEATTIFTSLLLQEKKEFLAHLMHELTVVARDNYEVGRDGLTNPQRMRRVNEIQHRVSDFLLALLCDDGRRYPDDLLMRIVLEHPDDKVLEQDVNAAFARVMTHRRLSVA